MIPLTYKENLIKSYKKQKVCYICKKHLVMMMIKKVS